MMRREARYLLGLGWKCDPQGRTPGWYWFGEYEMWFPDVEAAYARQQKIDGDRFVLPTDMVNSPPHYNQAGIEVIEVIEAYHPGNYRLGNVLKYVCRCDHKGHRLNDLKKALWYLTREIEISEHMEEHAHLAARLKDRETNDAVPGLFEKQGNP